MAEQQKIGINYVEFASPELEKTQAFFAKAFGWEFINKANNTGTSKALASVPVLSGPSSEHLWLFWRQMI